MSWRLRTPQGNPPDSLLRVLAPDGGAMVHIRQLGIRDSAGSWRAQQFEGEVLVKRGTGNREQGTGNGER